MLQPAFSDCLFLYLLSHFQDPLASAVIDVGGCQVVKALVVSTVVIVIDKRTDLPFQIAGQKVVFQENSVLHGLVPPFDLTLGLGVMWRTTNVIHAFILKIVCKIGRHIGRAARHWARTNGAFNGSLAKQPWLIHDLGLHRCAKLPSNDVAAVVVEDRG